MREFWSRNSALIKRILIIICFTYLAHYFFTNRSHLGVLFKFNIWQIFGVLLLLLVNNFLYGFRLQHVFARTTGKAIGFMKWLKLAVLGRFLNHFVPQLGNVYRSKALKDEFKINHATYISSFTGFIWLDTCANFTLLILVVHVLELKMSVFGIPLLYTLYLCLSGLIGAPFLVALLSNIKVSENFRLLHWIKGRFDEAVSVIMLSVRSPRYVVQFFLLACAGSLVTMAMFWCIFAGLGLEITVLELLIFNLVHRLASTIVITPGNLGLRELIFGALSSSFSLGLASGAIASGVLRVASFAVLLILGYLLGGRAIMSEQMKPKVK